MKGSYGVRRSLGAPPPPPPPPPNEEFSSGKGNSIISGENLLAYCETGEEDNPRSLTTSKRIRVALGHGKVGQMLVHFFESHRRQSQVPMGVVTVATRKGRALLTQWLLEFLAETGLILDLGGKTTDIPENYDRISNISDLEGVSNGVYISPKAYLVTGDKSRGSVVVLWVVYVDENSVEELQLFTELVASSTIQVGVKDLQSTSGPPIMGNMEEGLKRRFWDKLKELTFFPAKIPPNDQPITLNDFHAYLQFVADKVNSMSTQKRGRSENLPNVVPLQNTARVPITGVPIQNTARVPITGVPIQNTARVPITGVPIQNTARVPIREAPVQNTARVPAPIREVAYLSAPIGGNWTMPSQKEPAPLKNDIAIAPPPSGDKEVTKWFEELLDKNNLSDIFHMLQGQGQTSREILLVLEIFQPYTSQMYNMFDNYVCFYGSQDTGEMAQFLERGKNRAVDAFRSKRPLFDPHTNGVIERGLERAFHKVGILLREENSNIIRKEVALADMVVERMVEGYRSKMTPLAGSLLENPKMLGVAHLNMNQRCLGILQECLDYGGKLNFVMTEKHKELEGRLRRSLEEIIRMWRVKQVPSIRVTQPSPSQELRPVQECVQGYMALMRERWSEIAPRPLEEQRKFHEELLVKCLQDKEGNSFQGPVKEEVTLRLHNYFGHVIESLAQLNEKTAVGPSAGDDISTAEPFCVHLTPESIRVTGTTENGKSRCLLFGPNGDSSHLPPILVLSKDNQFMYGWEAIRWMKEYPSGIQSRGGVTTYLNDDSVVSRRMLGDLFIHLKCHVERSFLENKLIYTRVVLLVPSWFTWCHRSRLREACKRAGLSQVYILNEAPLAAHLALRRQSSVSRAVVVIQTTDHVQVKLYKSGAPDVVEGGVQLIALAQAPYLTEDPTRQSNLISSVYQAALAQDIRGQKIKSVAIYESFQWLHAYQSFVKATPEIVQDDGGGKLRESEVTLKALLGVASKPDQILSFLCDRGIDFEPLLSPAGTPSPRSPPAIIPSVQKPILSILEEQGAEMKAQMRHNLQDKCSSIQRQINNGAVSLDFLSEKLARGVLEGAEAVVQDVSATIEDLNERLEQIYDLIDHYKFFDGDASSQGGEWV